MRIRSHKGREFQKGHEADEPNSSGGNILMANIAEGFIRRSDKEFIQFLYISMSSSGEVRSHLYVALDQGYLDQNNLMIFIAGQIKSVR